MMNTALWMEVPQPEKESCIAVYRCCFTLDETTRIRFRYSADERAQLFLDGKRLQEGPERGCPKRWYYQNAEFTAEKGAHVLTARVLHFPFNNWAYAQTSVRHGFYVEEEGSCILKEWECQIEGGCTYEHPFPDWGAFPRVHLTEEYNKQILEGAGGEWQKVRYFRDERKLFAPDLPLMKYEKILPDSCQEGLFHFKEYVCVWATYRFSGKGKVKIRWAETPYLTEEYNSTSLKGNKGDRSGKFFVGNFDTFEIDGDLHWFDYWWRAGHYVQILTEGDVRYEAEFYRTGYPYPEEIQGSTPLEKMAISSLFNCSFETYMDCPYYEQLMYISDTRLAALYAYSLTGDHRLTAKALRLFACGQRDDGSLNAQYPSCSIQTIPSFMLIYFLMLHDYYEHHGNDELVRELVPCCERLLDFLVGNLNKEGLLEMEGWNFIDWHPDWDSGVPCDGSTSILNFLFVLALQACVDLQIRPALAEKLIPQLKEAIRRHFYDEERALYAVDPEKKIFSEHPQVLALLADQDTRVIPGLRKYDLTPCSISFSYYYMEACRRFGLEDLLQKRIEKWKHLPEEGLTTFPEEFVDPRSDCHTWGAYVMLFMKDQTRK